MNNLKTFRQTEHRQWMWFLMIVFSVFGMITALFVPAVPVSAFFTNLFFALAAYWIDKLEKEITRRNKEAMQPLPEHDDNKRAGDGD